MLCIIILLLHKNILYSSTHKCLHRTAIELQLVRTNTSSYGHVVCVSEGVILYGCLVTCLAISNYFVLFPSGVDIS